MTLEQIYAKVNTYGSNTHNIYVPDMDVFQELVTLLISDKGLSQLLAETEDADTFINKASILKACFPRSTKESLRQAYYMVKNGLTCVDKVKPEWVYWILKANEAYNMPNLIFKILPDAIVEEILNPENIPAGYSMRDILCTLISPKYHPVATANPICKYDSFTEVYIKATDMVAVVPNDIADKLTPKSVNELTVDSLGIKLEGQYLRTMGKYVGAVNSTYDLREII